MQCVQYNAFWKPYYYENTVAAFQGMHVSPAKVALNLPSDLPSHRDHLHMNVNQCNKFEGCLDKCSHIMGWT